MANRAKKFSICEAITFQLLMNLPVKSLMRFKCVSKEWLGIIADSYFVKCHSARSHTRPGAIQLLSIQLLPSQLLPVISGDFSSCILSDPEGNSRIASTTSFYSSHKISYAEALVCFNDRIWNPSTRESMNLPPANNCSFTMLLSYHNLLGFDAVTNRYRVLCCFNNTNLPNRVHGFQVLTLGENSWKKIPFIPELHQGFKILSSRSFSNMIFCLIQYGVKLGILTFDVQREDVGFISFPYKYKLPLNFHEVLVEIDGRLAFRSGIERTLWVLNHEIAQWTIMKITIPGSRFNSWCDYVHDGIERILVDMIPVGTIHTNEILFHCHVRGISFEKEELKYFYYDPKTKKIRFVRNLASTVDGISTSMMMKHVDSMVSLKPPK